MFHIKPLGAPLLPEAPVRPYRDALLAEPLADEELERRPGTTPRVEHAVDLPLGEERVVLLARLGPVGERRQAAELPGKLRALLDGALEPLLAERDVEPGFA